MIKKYLIKFIQWRIEEIIEEKVEHNPIFFLFDVILLFIISKYLKLSEDLVYDKEKVIKK